MAFLYALPGAVAEGLIWGLMAIGVYISYKILDIADLSVDGSIATGACVCVVMSRAGAPIWLGVLAAIIAGMMAGILTGLLHTLLGVPSILAGILTQLMLYSVNITILGGKSMLGFDLARNHELWLNASDSIFAMGVGVLIVAIIIVVLWLFFYTEVGLTLKSTGDNPDMSRAQGINVQLNKVIGLGISNGIVALAGALMAQYKGTANLNDGRGAIVIGLAAIFIGLSVSLKIKPNFVVSLIGVVGGGIVYFIIYTFVFMMGLPTEYLKMLSALIVAVFLGIPYLKSTYFAKKVPLDIGQGGGENA